MLSTFAAISSKFAFNVGSVIPSIPCTGVYAGASTFTASTPLTFPRLLIAVCNDAASSVFPAAFAASSCC